jgi:hypothetical protein
MVLFIGSGTNLQNKFWIATGSGPIRPGAASRRVPAGQAEACPNKLTLAHRLSGNGIFFGPRPSTPDSLQDLGRTGTQIGWKSRFEVQFGRSEELQAIR